jgi:acyl-CoA thioesterase FadM
MLADLDPFGNSHASPDQPTTSSLLSDQMECIDNDLVESMDVEYSTELLHDETLHDETSITVLQYHSMILQYSLTHCLSTVSALSTICLNL